MKIKICFGEILNELIEERKISTAELSARTSISRTTIYEWRNGFKNPNLDWRIAELSRFFNVTADYLIFGIGKENRIVKKEKSEKDQLTLFECRRSELA